MNNFFSNNIKSLRVDNDFTQQEIADALGITRSRYSNYENGINEPSLDILIRLSKLFNCSIDDLLKIKINTIIKNKIDSIITEEPETSLGLNEFNYSDLKKKLIENRSFYEKKKKTILGEIDVKISEIDSVLDFINNLYTEESLNEISHNKKDE
ncbi:helix-turn-helix domain-containing protein [Clostridium sp. NSJ-6]|uniref:Helix-turn-helix domain-containing protein n=1 Tax=Clostridium hominis TaxID=2763036 RepID=A0ABR7DGK3_9CLOT|nr:helix-turn-helix domain-containing protein [Clostridium hominis]MBC5630536.1 helix-turn-helix domain-containing protein [Clostridium hominis]